MLWNGFPLFRYLLLWVFLSWVMSRFYWYLDSVSCRLVQCNGQEKPRSPTLPMVARTVICVLVMLVLVVGARGTLRSGPPLRWGDAFHGQNLFANHLGLNGIFTLYKATRTGNGKTNKNFWLNAMPIEKATSITQGLLLTTQDTPSSDGTLTLLRTHQGNEKIAQSYDKKPNIVVILMESFSGVYTGVLGNNLSITPSFDRLAQQGLLFTRFFQTARIRIRACLLRLPASLICQATNI